MAIATPNNIAGYDYNFVDTPHNRYICNVCHLPSRDPYLSVCCGHVFCKFCLDNVKKASAITNACPVCRDEEFVTFPNRQLDREIRSLHIYCTNKEKGCKWQGELNDINNHLGNSGGCQFEGVKCSNECGKMIERRYLTNHVKTECPSRKINCQYCHDTGEHQFIEGQHKEECPKLPLLCPNKCEVGSVPREDMEMHRKKCQLEVIECSNECGKMIERRYLTSHVETECPRRKVNCQYCHDTGEHQFIEGQHKEECPKFPLPCPNKCKVVTFPRENMEAHRKECPLEMIQCEYHNVGCKVMIARQDQEKHKKEKMEEHLMMTKHKLTDTEGTLANTNNQLASALQRISTLEVLLYQITDRAVFRPTSVVLVSSAEWSVKLAAMTVVSKSGDQECPVIFKVSQFNNKKENNVTWYSDSFYTHNKGYKMCLRVDAAGICNGKGTHLSAFLYLMKGPHDDELTWPLRGKFEMKLLNQISDSKHCSKLLTYDGNTPLDNDKRVTKSDRAAGWGSYCFISNENLHKTTPTCQYLKDDCLFFQVTKL